MCMSISLLGFLGQYKKYFANPFLITFLSVCCYQKELARSLHFTFTDTSKLDEFQFKMLQTGIINCILTGQAEYKNKKKL